MTFERTMEDIDNDIPADVTEAQLMNRWLRNRYARAEPRLFNILSVSGYVAMA